MNYKMILLVEDNADDEALTLRALNKNKIANKIEVVRDGAEALDFLFGTGAHAERDQHELPQVILLDLKLPKVDGLEVLREIRRDPGLRTIPVVMLTSSREERDMLESYHLGVNAYVVKPVGFPEFVNALREVGLFWAVINLPPPGST